MSTQKIFGLIKQLSAENTGLPTKQNKETNLQLILADHARQAKQWYF